MRPTQEQRDRAIQMLAEGIPQAEVARKLGFPRQTISRWAKESKSEIRELREKIVPPPPSSEPLENKNAPQYSTRDFYRYQEMLFLNELQELIMPQVREGTLRAVNTALEISKARRQLLALDECREDILDSIDNLTKHGFHFESSALIISESIESMKKQLLEITNERAKYED